MTPKMLEELAANNKWTNIEPAASICLPVTT